jgi:hypothetical protein
MNAAAAEMEARDRDWSDIEGVRARQHGRLDLAHVRRELPQLLELKGDSESLPRLDRTISAVQARLAP